MTKRRSRRTKHLWERPLRMKANARNASLANFLSPDGPNCENRGKGASLPDSIAERAVCPDCGTMNEVIKRGYRNTKYRGQVQRYQCKICRKRFVHSPYTRMRWPDWVVDAVLDLKVNGLRDSQIAKAVANEAKRHNEEIRLSPKSIINIVRRAVRVILEFERYAPRKEKAATWLIDDTPQPWSKNRPPCGNTADTDTDSADEYLFFWITNVLEEENRYWLSGVSSDNRSYVNSETATRLALLRAKYGPQLVKCDGYKGHNKGVRQVLKHVEIIAKSKKEDYGWINYVERLHQTIRSLAIKKRRHFRALENLGLLVELVRIYYNFMRPHESLNGIPPAKRAGVEYPYHEGLTWSELIRFAFGFLRKRRRPF